MAKSNRRWRNTPFDGEEQAFSGMSSRCLPFKRVGTVRSELRSKMSWKSSGNFVNKNAKAGNRACLVPSKNWRLEWRLEWNIRWSACVKKIVYIIHPFWWFGIWSKSQFSMFCFFSRPCGFCWQWNVDFKRFEMMCFFYHGFRLNGLEHASTLRIMVWRSKRTVRKTESFTPLFRRVQADSQGIYLDDKVEGMSSCSQTSKKESV